MVASVIPGYIFFLVYRTTTDEQYQYTTQTNRNNDDGGVTQRAEQLARPCDTRQLGGERYGAVRDIT